MKYAIVITRGMSMYTAYTGHSYSAASKTVDLARAILILTNGTATISAQYDGGTLYPVWDVVDGEASAKVPVRRNPIIEVNR